MVDAFGRIGGTLTGLLIARDATGALAGAAIGAAAVAMAGWLVTGRTRPRKHHVGHVKDVLHAVSAMLALVLLVNLDLVLARHYLPAHDAGEYAVGAIVAKIAYWLPQAVAILVLPRLASAEGRRRMVPIALALCAALDAVVIAGTALLGPTVVAVIGGADYADSGIPVWPFALVGSMLSLVQILLYSRIASNDRKSTLLIWLAVAVEIVLVTSWLNGALTQVVTAAVIATGLLVCAGAVVELRSRRERSPRPVRTAAASSGSACQRCSSGARSLSSAGSCVPVRWSCSVPGANQSTQPVTTAAAASSSSPCDTDPYAHSCPFPSTRPLTATRHASVAPPTASHFGAGGHSVRTSRHAISSTTGSIPPSTASSTTSAIGTHRRPPPRTSIGRRRIGTNSEPASANAVRPPISSPVRYWPSGAKSSSTVPPRPAGTSHACCQPSTRTRSSVRPSMVATQPSFAFSGTDSTASPPPPTRTDRCVVSQPVTENSRPAGSARRVARRQHPQVLHHERRGAVGAHLVLAAPAGRRRRPGPRTC